MCSALIAKSMKWQIIFIVLIQTRFDPMARISSREFYEFLFQGPFLVYAYTVCQSSEIPVSCMISRLDKNLDHTGKLKKLRDIKAATIVIDARGTSPNKWKRDWRSKEKSRLSKQNFKNQLKYLEERPVERLNVTKTSVNIYLLELMWKITMSITIRPANKELNSITNIFVQGELWHHIPPQMSICL